MTCRRFTQSLMLAAAMVAGSSDVAAQSQAPSPLQRIRSFGLETSASQRVTTYFAAKDRIQATRLTPIIEMSAIWYQGVLGVSLRPLHLAVLSPDFWFVPYAGGDQEPYGMPWGWVEDALMTAPASLTEGVLITGPDNPANIQRIQFVLLHEFGHLLNKQHLHPDSPHPYSPVRWLEELLATYHAYAFVHTMMPAWAATSRAEWEEFVAGYTPAVISLDWSFMRELPPAEFGRTYAWYQNLLNLRVAELYEEHGNEFLKRVKSELPWAEADTWTTEQILPLLERIAPGFETWAADPANGRRRTANGER